MDSALSTDAFNPFQHLVTAFGLPGFILSAVSPQVQQLAKRWPRVWRFLTLAVVAHLGYQYAWQKLIRTLKYLLTFAASSIKIYESDELMGCFTRWLDSQKPGFIQDSNMTGLTRQFLNINKNLAEQNANFHSNLTGVQPNNFVLQKSYNVSVFRYRSRIFWISSDSENGFNDWNGQREDKKFLKIWTLGRSVKPIANILDEAIENHANDGEKLATTMYIPSGGSGGGDWGYDGRRGSGMWITRAVKPCRPLETVYLSGHQRRAIADDVAWFLHPDSAIRFRKKGIPHRRGYLLYGPPGNGKTSLAMALAGHFGLNVYSVSLRDPNMSDSYLASLFNVLPPTKVLVLMEDIDSSGLVREAEFDENEIDQVDQFGVHRSTRVTQQRAITLSGVLNAIDGIAAPEGHILVMTTNAPEKLDKALIRPGRVDVKVEFQNATQSQLHDMFERMYRDEDVSSEDSAAADIASSSSNEKSTVTFPTEPIPQNKRNPPPISPINAFPAGPPQLSPAELAALADRFSTTFPSKVCSLAEVQNYLLGRIDDPQRAVDEAQEWVADFVRQKAEAEERKKQKAVQAALEQEEMKKRIKEAGSGLGGDVMPGFSFAGSGGMGVPVVNGFGVPKGYKAGVGRGVVGFVNGEVVEDGPDGEAVNGSVASAEEVVEVNGGAYQANGAVQQDEPKAVEINGHVD